MGRQLVVHLHIFKNAGTTVDSALRACFGAAFEQYDGERAGHRISDAEFRELVASRPDMSALSSHQLQMPLPAIPSVDVMPVVVLREPLDRAQSVWSFERRQRARSPGAIHAKKLSVDDYVRWRFKQGEISVISDFQAGVLGREVVRGPVSNAHALERLRACAAVGVVERMPESMLAAEHRLRPAFPLIDLSFVSRNVTTGRAPTAAERVETFFELVGPSLADELRRRNSRDLELYEEANRELDRRLAAIPDLDSAADDFRERCRRREDARPTAARAQG